MKRTAEYGRIPTVIISSNSMANGKMSITRKISLSRIKLNNKEPEGFTSGSFIFTH
jgi:hypothetical protein